MILTINEQLDALGQRIKTRRIALNYTQQIAAERAGVAYRTWRRMETDGSASIDDLIRAAYALRCEDGIEVLFPEPVARSMDELLEMQRLAAKKKVRQRASRTKSASSF
jgi:transcriptional regulator with XRE-family HTH domain